MGNVFFVIRKFFSKEKNSIENFDGQKNFPLEKILFERKKRKL